MLTLKQYLGEIWNYKRFKKATHVNIDRLTDVSGNHSHSEEMSTAKTGHKIVKQRHGPGEPVVAFYAINPKTSKPDAEIYGELTGPKQNLLTVYSTAARTGSKIKASDLYHHLIKHHDMVIQSDISQHPGSVKLWKKLARKKDVSVHGWDKQRDKPVNVSPNIESDYNDIYADIDRTEYRKVRPAHKTYVGNNVTLVAHRKTK